MIEIYSTNNIVEVPSSSNKVTEIYVGYSIKGDKGDNALINGYNVLSIVDGENTVVTQIEDELQIDVDLSGYLTTETDPVYSADKPSIALKSEIPDISGKEDKANKGQALGYCELDGGSNVPLANLPSTLLKYIGTWNANTNTPTLENPDTTKKGNVYVVSTTGTQFGISFKMGDWLIYNDSGVPEKSDNSDDVVSVNSKTGTVVLNTDDLLDTATKRFVTDTEKGVWNGKQDSGYVAYTNTKTSLDATLIVSTMYELGTLTGNISMALPSGTTRKRICVKFNCTGTAYTFTLTGTNFTTFSLTPVANTCYDVEFEYNGATSKWTGYVNSYLA